MTNRIKDFLNKLDAGRGLTLSQRLLGVQAAPTDAINIKGVDTISPEYAENMAGAPADITISDNPRVGGILPDISAGYHENRFNPVSLNNFGKSISDDGRRKGFAYKLGEGLGSFARFADSPLGRGLLMAGIVGATGGGALPAMTFGATTGFGNKQVRVKDQLYRNALEQQGVDTSNIKGYVTDEPFENYTLANYRNRNLDVKMHLGTLNDNTKRAQLINTMLNSGELDPNEAVNLLSEYGINIDSLEESNKTKLVPYIQMRAKAYSDWMTNKTHNNKVENADLAEFLEIYNGNDNGKTEYARNAFIKKYGKDPYKLIKM